MSIRLDGGRVLPENEEEAVRSAIAGHGHINVTGYDDQDRWPEAMDQALKMLVKADKDPSMDFDLVRPRLPFEAFASQVGLRPIMNDVEAWTNGVFRAKESSGGGGSKRINGVFFSETNDSVWLVVYDYTSKEYWLEFCANNIFEIPDRFSLTAQEWFHPLVFQASCHFHGGPWPKGGIVVCETSLTLLGRKIEVLTYARLRGTGDSLTGWNERIFGMAEQKPNTHLLGGVFEVVYEPPHLFSGIKDPILRKFLIGPNASASRLYKFLKTITRDAIDRDILSRFGKQSGVSEELFTMNPDRVDLGDGTIEVENQAIKDLFRRAGIPE
jgi:hypothetical protein